MARVRAKFDQSPRDRRRRGRCLGGQGESYGFAVGNYQKGGRIVQSKDDKVKLYNGPITQKGKFSSTTGKCPT